MANPQCEDGFWKMSNELGDVAISELCSEELHVWLAVVRRTYGYNQKEAEIAIAELSIACSMPERTVRRILSGLVARGVLYARKNGPRPMVIGVVKDYDLWQGKRLAKNGQSTKRLAKNGQSRLAKNGQSKGFYHYEKNIRKKTVPRTPSEEALKVARGYHERVRALYPALTKTMTEKTDIEGALVLEDLVRIDGHDWEEVKRTLRWALTDAFWSKNLRSLAGARKKASGSGGATKFENCMAKMIDVLDTVRGAVPRPAPVVRTWAEGEERQVPNNLGFKNSPNGQDQGKAAPDIGKTA
jgi:phage replication O-like protein O